MSLKKIKEKRVRNTHVLQLKLNINIWIRLLSFNSLSRIHFYFKVIISAQGYNLFKSGPGRIGCNIFYLCSEYRRKFVRQPIILRS